MRTWMETSWERRIYLKKSLPLDIARIKKLQQMWQKP
uniref:Uncharacterized protein n=1 Tax=Rhizophora mucronata TaxID=61149 RepID=A0A2P2PV71_RHIMU